MAFWVFLSVGEKMDLAGGFIFEKRGGGILYNITSETALPCPASFISGQNESISKDLLRRNRGK